MSAEHDEDEFFESAEAPETSSASSQTVGQEKSPRIINNNKPIIEDPLPKEVEIPSIINDANKSNKDDAKAIFDDVATSSNTASGWGSWGSWTSTLTQVVNVASSTIAQQADKIYESLDPEYERERQAQRDRDARNKAITGGKNDDKSQSTDTTSPTSAPLPPLDPIEISKHAANAAEALLSKMDEGLNTVSDAVGNTLFSGYKKLDEKVGALRRDAATNEIVQQSKELSQDAIASSLAALEGLGQSAMNFFGSQRPNQQPLSKAKQVSPTKSFTAVFDEQPGGATLKAIESLSNGAQSQVSGLISQSSKPVDIKDIDSLFDVDSTVEDAESIEQRPFSADDKEFEVLVNAIKPLAAPAPSILLKVRDTVKSCEASTSEKLRFFNVLYDKKAPSDTTIDEFAEGLYLDLLGVLVSITENWCTLILRTAESQLMSMSDTTSSTKLVGVEVMQTLRNTCLHMINVITETMELYLSALAIVSVKYTRESVKKRVQAMNTFITNDGESAITVVQESFAYLAPICKLKLLSTSTES